jgi:hypothetical protein
MNIFYFAYDHQKPTGGQKSVYRHVDILNKNGISAYVIHSKENFRLTWFANTTRIAGPALFSSLYRATEDWIVLPEDLGKSIFTFPGKKVIVTQGPYLGFACFGLAAPKPYPYLHPDIKAVLVKSTHSLEYLTFAYPRQKFFRVYDGVDESRFPFVPARKKKKLIAAPKHKNQLDLMQVFHQIQSRTAQELNGLDGYEWVFIDDMPETEVAKTLGDALAFIFLSTIEGFGIMPLEAMLSGCVVAAYDVPPLTEYLSTGNSLLSPRGDIAGIVRTIETAAEDFSQSPEKLSTMVCSARSSARQFSLAREEASVVDAWQSLIQS